MPDPVVPPTGDGLDDVARAVSAGLADLDSGVARLVRRQVGRDLRRARSLQEAADGLAAHAQQLEDARRRLEAGRERLRVLQSTRLEREPFGLEWREQVRAGLLAAPDDRSGYWLSRFAEAFAAGAFAACLWLCDEPTVRPSTGDVGALRGSADAASRGLLAYTLPALERLTDPASPAALPADVLARCWCMRGRVVSRALADPGQAVDLLTRALDTAADWPAEARAELHVALLECHLQQGTSAAAREQLRAALRNAPRGVTTLVASGLLAETTGNPARAEQSYDRALGIDRERAVAGALFAPVPPTLLWRYGRRVRDSEPERAVESIERALRGGQLGRSAHEEKAYVDLAKAHEALGNTEQAAHAYWQAGRRFAISGDQATASDYLRRAATLEPQSSTYHSSLAEALVQRAVCDDGHVELALLDDAREAWSRAMRLVGPEGAPAEAFLTGAALAHHASGHVYRPRASHAAVLVLERGLLAAPGHVRLLAHLSQAHRLVGHAWTALGLVEPLLGQSEDGDQLVLDQYLLALLELDRCERLLEVVAERALDPGTPWLVNRRVQALLQLGRSGDAAELLRTRLVADGASHWLQVGVCEWLEQRPTAARECYARARTAGDAGGQPREYLAAWADHLLGEHERAAREFERLRRRDPLDASLLRQHGQVLLARGWAGDVERGAEELHAGVLAALSPYGLDCLLRLDLPRLVEAVRGAPHEDGVRRVLAEVEPLARQVRDSLRRPPDAETELRDGLRTEGRPEDDRDQEAACRLALARLAATSRQSEAVRLYTDAVRLDAEAAHGGAVPEARLGLRRAVTASWREAESVARAEPERGLALCVDLLPALDSLPDSDALAAGTRLRAALLAARTGDDPAFAEHLDQALRAPRSEEHDRDLAEAVTRLVDTPETFWPLREVALRSRNGGGRGTGQRRSAAADWLLGTMGLAPVLRSRREDVEASRLFPLVPPLTLRLAADLLPPDSPDARRRWHGLLRELRDEVRRDLGVPLPGISLTELPGAAGDRFEVLLYGDLRAAGDAGVDGPPDPAERWAAASRVVVEHLRSVVLVSLSRLFSLDDAALWLSSAAPRTGLRPGRGFGPADGLELQRLLRLLLRERVPVLDHAAVLEEIRVAGPGWRAPQVLPAVRRRLLRGAPPAGRAAVLPEHLENAVRGGLAGDEAAVWRAPREEVTRLLERLVQWHEDSGRATTVVVREPSVRPVLWRLLAVTLPGVQVLAEEEIRVDA